MAVSLYRARRRNEGAGEFAAWRNRIEAAGMQWRALDQAHGRENEAQRGAMLAYCLNRVVRAGGRETTPTSGSKDHGYSRGNYTLISLQKRNQNTGRNLEESHDYVHGSDFFHGRKLPAGFNEFLL